MEGVVDVTMASRGPKPAAGGEEEADSTDWQSVVKDMLSIHLPSSRLQPRPINTDRSAAAADFGGDGLSQSHKSFAALAFPADPEPLRSGSPRASRSPMAVASPRSSASGLLLLRIDESQALDTSSDCGSDLGDPHDLAGTPFRRSRLGSDSGHARASFTGGDEWDAAVAREAEERAAAGPSHTEAHADILESDVVGIKGLQIKTSSNSPQAGKAAPAPGGNVPAGSASLAKYRPSKMAAVFPASHSRKMRRSVIHRISDHGGSTENEEGRLRLEEERLELECLKRDVEATVCGMKSLQT